MSFLPLFSHIYIEEDARRYPLTQGVLDRFPKAAQISIQDYKEIFNRPRQRWDHQKNSLKLILAVRRDAFLYPGSPFVPNFDHSRFFYTTPALNCLYGCEYCYLQGMFPSANVVCFVNSSEFIDAATAQLTGPQPAYLCVSYDTDLLAMEEIFGLCAEWITFARANPHVTLEIRTKSAATKVLESIPITPNVVIAWTISPEQIITRYEHRTPRLAARLKAIQRALNLGWTVRLCVDPILKVQDWRAAYSGLLEETFGSISGNSLHDISLGVFRIASGYLKQMRRNSPSSTLAHYPYTVVNESASYLPEESRELLDFVSHELSKYVSKEKICPVPWQL